MSSRVTICLQFRAIVLERERPVAFVLKALQQRILGIALERYSIEAIGLVDVVINVVKQLRISQSRWVSCLHFALCHS